MIKTINYEEGKILVFDEETSVGKVYSIEEIDNEIASVNEAIRNINSVLADDTKLLDWARTFYPSAVGLDSFNTRLTYLEELIK